MLGNKSLGMYNRASHQNAKTCFGLFASSCVAGLVHFSLRQVVLRTHIRQPASRVEEASRAPPKSFAAGHSRRRSPELRSAVPGTSFLWRSAGLRLLSPI